MEEMGLRRHFADGKAEGSRTWTVGPAHGDPQMGSGVQGCLGTLSAIEVAEVPPQRFWVVGQWSQRRPWGLQE